MRMSNILLLIWFVIVVVLDKFVQPYYNIVLLTISGIFLYAIHKVNMKERTRAVEETKQYEIKCQ